MEKCRRDIYIALRCTDKSSSIIRLWAEVKYIHQRPVCNSIDFSVDLSCCMSWQTSVECP